MDPIAQFKANAKQVWAGFAPTEMLTGAVAPRLVRFAGVEPGARVLDVGCGTGVVSLTAARLGARVTGLDLTPELLARAKENAEIMALGVDWHEGDVEALPFTDAAFDVVVSQFGHMFAPRPAAAIAEMLRVLKPGGTVAFSTWPPDLFVGQMFSLAGRYGPPPPPGISPPSEWGDERIVRERLGSAVKDVLFDRDVMSVQMLSIQHQRAFMERNIGPIGRVVKALETTDPPRLAEFRADLERLAARYFEDNHVRQGYLLSRATKV
jgi:SAM-dependent methyltransferase